MAFEHQRHTRLFKELLPRFVRESESGPELERYGLMYRYGRKGYQADQGRIYWDAEFGIGLTLDNATIAGIGFEPLGSTLLVRQIQGLLGQEWALRTFRWERLLVSILANLAQEASPYKELRIINASDCPFYEEGDNPADAERRDILGRRYNGTARALKFTWDKRNRNWVKVLRTG